MKALSFQELREELCLAARDWEPIGNTIVVRLWHGYSKHQLFWDSGTHGQECATPLALLKLVKEYGGDNWPWPNVELTAIVADAKGFDELGYGFIGMEGDESCWPPLWGYRQDNRRYWTFDDRNSACRRIAESGLPETARELRCLMHETEPDVVLSTHETVENEELYHRHPFWHGAGLLAIETYPIWAGDYAAMQDPPDPIGNLPGFMYYLWRRWVWALVGIPRWKRNAKVLAGNPGFEFCGRVMKRYEDLGGQVLKRDWQRFMEAAGDAFVAPGRLLHGPEFYASDWDVVTSYATRRFGSIGITTETFPPGEIGLLGLDDRIEQTYLFARAVLDEMEEENDSTRGSKGIEETHCECTSGNE